MNFIGLLGAIGLTAVSGVNSVSRDFAESFVVINNNDYVFDFSYQMTTATTDNADDTDIYTLNCNPLRSVATYYNTNDPLRYLTTIFGNSLYRSYGFCSIGTGSNAGKTALIYYSDSTIYSNLQGTTGFFNTYLDSTYANNPYISVLDYYCVRMTSCDVMFHYRFYCNEGLNFSYITTFTDNYFSNIVNPHIYPVATYFPAYSVDFGVFTLTNTKISNYQYTLFQQGQYTSHTYYNQNYLLPYHYEMRSLTGTDSAIANSLDFYANCNPLNQTIVFNNVNPYYASTSGQAINDAYNQGYGQGYTNGHDDGLNEGINIGYENGYNTGYATGKTDGIATSNDYTFLGLFGAVADTPVIMVRNLFNFDFFGVNLLTVVLSLFTGVILFYLLRKLL